MSAQTHLPRLAAVLPAGKAPFLEALRAMPSRGNSGPRPLDSAH